PTAEIKGVEGDFAFSATDSFQIDGSFAWNDATTAEASTLSVTDEEGETFTFAVEEGARLPLTPDWSANLGLEFRPSFAWGSTKPYARLDYSYVGHSVNSLEGIESVVSGNPVQVQQAYEIVNLRLGLDGEKWSGS